MYEAEDDPYCYPGTDVLQNKFGIEDAEILAQLETELTTARADELFPQGHFDRAHYQAVHRHLFQDIYDWAGEVRTVRLSKGDSHFCYPEHIPHQLDQLFDELSTDDLLVGLPVAEFCTKAAAFLATLNVIHSFREGNGRTQLSFLALLASAAGHPIDFRKMEPSEMLEAMIASFFGNEVPLESLLIKIAD